MRYPASEKLEIINLVEQWHLPAKRTLDQLGIPRRTFYRWYVRYLGGCPEALEDRPSAPDRVWNRIPVAIHDQIIEMALEQVELSRRELAVQFTDETCSIIAWKLFSTIRAQDVTDTLDMALATSGCDSFYVQHKPRLLSDNGPCYIVEELAHYFKTKAMSHVRGTPMHPLTQGKI